MAVRTRLAGGWGRSRLVADCTQNAIDVRTLGVTGSGSDETTVMQAALDSLTSGQVLDLRGLTVVHAGVLKILNAGVSLIGPGELRATTPAACSLIVQAANCTVQGLTLSMPDTQIVTITGSPTAGGIALSVVTGGSTQTTATIARNATASTVQTALAALSNVGTGNVTVTGGPGPDTAWTVAFVGTLILAPPPIMGVTSTLSAGTVPAVTVAPPLRISSPRNSHRLCLDFVANPTVRDVTVIGSAATGIRNGGCTGVLLERAHVIGSRADGIHFTDSTHDAIARDCTVEQNGDDSISVVSYDNDVGGPCYNISVTGARVGHSLPKGRGLTVVGGHDITFDDFVVTNPCGAGIYVACEAGFATRAVQAVTFRNGSIVGASQAVVYGAIMISNTRPTVDAVGIDDVLLDNIDITGTLTATSDGSTVNRIVRFTDNPGAVTRICARNIRVVGGPTNTFTTSLAASGYRNTAWTRGGSSIADVGTFTPIR